MQILKLSNKRKIILKKIAIVVGHRETSPGAFGNSGVSEWDFYNEFSKELLEDSENINSVELKIFHRKEHGTGYNQRMVELHKDIDKWGADISVSLHFNASSIKSANGHEVLYCNNCLESRKYATIMNNAFSVHLENRNRGVKAKNKSDRGGGFLCKGKSHCILIEPFFASDQSNYMPGTEGRNELLSAIRYFLTSI